MAEAARAATRKAGRNLSAAIAVGLGLMALIVATLMWRAELFAALVTGAILVGQWELTVALRSRGIAVPLLPLWVGSVGMGVSAWVAGAGGLFIALVLTSAAIFVWRVLEGGGPAAARDTAAGIFLAAYVGFLTSFMIVIVRMDNGVLLVLTLILVVAASDTGGYAAGVLFGKRPLAPSISPKKTWEGLAGQLVLASVLSWVMLVTVLGFPPVYALALGVLLVVVGMVGDLGESLIKRDLGIKDLGDLLPGHGGVLDRIDSHIVASPVCYFVFSLAVG